MLLDLVDFVRSSRGSTNVLFASAQCFFFYQWYDDFKYTDIGLCFRGIMMSDAQEKKGKTDLHPLVEQARAFLEKAAVRAKIPTEAVLTEAEFQALAKKVKAFPGDPRALGVDLIAEALALHRIHWKKSVNQMLNLAALVLSDDAMRDELCKSASHPLVRAGASSRSTIAGLPIPGKTSAKKGGRR